MGLEQNIREDKGLLRKVFEEDHLTLERQYAIIKRVLRNPLIYLAPLAAWAYTSYYYPMLLDFLNKK